MRGLPFIVLSCLALWGCPRAAESGKQWVLATCWVDTHWAYDAWLAGYRVYDKWRVGYTPAPHGSFAGEVKTEPKAGYSFVWLPDGSFTVPTPKYAANCPCRQKKPEFQPCTDPPKKRTPIVGFWMGKNDVTVDEYEACIRAGKCSSDAQSRDQTSVIDKGGCNLKHGRFNHPMNCVNWSEALAFCHWLGGGLPTVGKWLYANESGEDTRYPWGNAPVTEQRGNFSDLAWLNSLDEHRRKIILTNRKINMSDGWAYTSPVGTFSAGATKWGLLDMAGNVEQWTVNANDRFERGVVGSSWMSHPEDAGFPTDGNTDAGGWYTVMGFRCVQ